MNAGQRNHEIEVMLNRLEELGHRVVTEGLCLHIDSVHHHQASRHDMHAFLSGAVAMAERYGYSAHNKQKESE